MTPADFPFKRNELRVPVTLYALAPNLAERGVAVGEVWQSYTNYVYTMTRLTYRFRYMPIEKMPWSVRRAVRKVFGTVGFDGDFGFGYREEIYFNYMPGQSREPNECVDQIAHLFHELTHLFQQSNGPLRWLVRYYRHPDFRLQMEAEAHLVGYYCRWLMFRRRYGMSDMQRFARRMQTKYLIPRSELEIVGLLRTMVDANTGCPKVEETDGGKAARLILGDWGMR